MGQCLGRLVESRWVQLMPRPQQMANSLQRQGRRARLVESRSEAVCVEECGEARE